ncbi:hypothetical protein KXQ82_13420 [Mucilaginibacter sp. HMF5004]|uniref:hypothetical protein n=1 Tax=Mucilaginibacter rivuli TaxID=2857527 RepID=UPI001C600189|nr:hypothetical protein [Mucilaginibacter rivuli]MBW4890726.1 hypothetical protein [Mucilaginibacter rivuli]
MNLQTEKQDWFDDLSEENQKIILEGLAQADNGEVISHEVAIKIFGKYGLE